MGVKSSLREAEHLLGGDNDFLPGSFNAVILCINSVGNVYHHQERVLSRGGFLVVIPVIEQWATEIKL